MALVLACIIYNFPVNPFRNLTSTRFLEPFQPGRVLGVLEVGPGNLGKDILVSTVNRIKFSVKLNDNDKL